MKIYLSKINPINSIKKLKKIPNKISSFLNRPLFKEEPYKGKNKWFFFVLLFLFWLAIYFAYNFSIFLSSISYTNLLGLPLALLSSLLIIAVIYFISCDIVGVITIKQQQHFKSLVNDAIKSNNTDSLKKLLLSNRLVSPELRKKLQKSWQDMDNEEEIIKTFEKIVLKNIDKEIDKTIKKTSILLPSATIISSKPWLDIVITSIFFSKMAITIAKEYKIKIGIISFFKIIFLGLVGYSVTNLVSKGAEMLTKSIPYIGKITEAGAGSLIIRQLGLKVKYALRPIPADYSVTYKKETKNI